MKNTIIAILGLFLIFLGLHYIIFVEDSQKLLQAVVALAWGIAFHFAALKLFPDSYIFAKRNKQVEDKS